MFIYWHLNTGKNYNIKKLVHFLKL
jgi:hypothetical protein